MARRMGHRDWTIGLLATTLLAMSACAELERQETKETEQLLSAAGFKMKLADTPEKRTQLQAMKQQSVLPRDKDGTLYFLYADAKDCGCLFVGTQENYQAYERLSVQREVTIANQEARLDAEEADELNWGAWGYPGW